MYAPLENSYYFTCPKSQLLHFVEYTVYYTSELLIQVCPSKSFRPNQLMVIHVTYVLSNLHRQQDKPFAINVIKEPRFDRVGVFELDKLFIALTTFFINWSNIYFFTITDQVGRRCISFLST